MNGFLSLLLFALLSGTSRQNAPAGRATRADPVGLEIQRATALAREGEYEEAERAFNEIFNQAAPRVFARHEVFAKLEVARDTCLYEWRQNQAAAAGLRDVVLNCDMRLRDQSVFEEHLELFLRHDPKHAKSNFFSGYFAFGRGDYQAAETRLKQSVETKPDASNHNCYACALQRLDRNEESEKHARLALELASQGTDRGLIAAIQDTLAVALIGQGKFDEARAACEESFNFADGRVFAPLKLTRLQILVGTQSFDEARALRDELALRAGELDAYEREVFIRLSDTITENARQGF